MVEILLSLNVSRTLIRVIYNFLIDRSALVQINSSCSTLRPIPIGCVQGSVLGPVLFNIYTSQLTQNINADFVVSYADDTYVAVAVPKRDIFYGLWKINLVCEDHFNWLATLGMVYNSSKTDFVIFGKNLILPKHCQLSVKGSLIDPKDSLTVLGIKFMSDLSCKKQVVDNIKSANSQIYALRYLNNRLNRSQFRQVIHAHYISRLLYASPLWARNINETLTNKLNSCMYRVMRLFCKDFSMRYHRSELVILSQLRNFHSQRIIAEAATLQSLMFHKNSGYLTDRLAQQSYTNPRFKGFVVFRGFVKHRPGAFSFIHHAKQIAELITFPWLDLHPKHFKRKIKKETPMMINI